MGEKTKNAIMEILQSEDMREYFEKMLREQTGEIVASIQNFEDNNLKKEIQELNMKLAEEQKNNQNLVQIKLELEMKNEQLSSIYEDLKTDYKNSLNQKKEIEDQIIILKGQNKQLASSIEEITKQKNEELEIEKKEKAVVSCKLEEYESKYACINKAYMNFEALPESVKQRMGNIFIKQNIYSFIVAVSDWNSIEGIWSFTKRRIIEDENEGIKNLVALFEDCFTLYNLIEGSGRYELINPAIGERFDSDKHSIKGINTDGQIEEVLLSGIYDTITKKSVFKAVVKIQ